MSRLHREKRNSIVGRYHTHDHYKRAACYASSQTCTPDSVCIRFSVEVTGSDCDACAQMETIHLGNLNYVCVCVCVQQFILRGDKQFVVVAIEGKWMRFDKWHRTRWQGMYFVSHPALFV